MGLREQKKELMRRRLYETAMALFRERGFEPTRVRDIIEQVEVSEATFFNYFPTKEAVLHESELEFKALYAIYLRELLGRSDESVSVRVRELVSVIGQLFADDRAFMADVVGRTGMFYGSTGRAMEMDMANFVLLGELLGQGQATGEINPAGEPLQLAEILTATFMLTIANWLTGWWGDVGDLDPRLMSAVGVFLQGCTTKSVL
jgi:TetR/AcrR family transcriptional regulator, cholesterol catabolism regulator